MQYKSKHLFIHLRWNINPQININPNIVSHSFIIKRQKVEMSLENSRSHIDFEDNSLRSLSKKRNIKQENLTK